MTFNPNHDWQKVRGQISSLRKQLKWINSYDYIITFIRWRKRKHYLHVWISKGPSFERTLTPFNKGMLCAKFVRKWLSGSWEEVFFKISPMYFRYFVIISPWEKHPPSFEQIYIPFSKWCFLLSSFEIGPLVLQGMMKMWKKSWKTDGQWRTDDRQSEKPTSVFSSRWANRAWIFTRIVNNWESRPI